MAERKRPATEREPASTNLIKSIDVSDISKLGHDDFTAVYKMFKLEAERRSFEKSSKRAIQSAGIPRLIASQLGKYYVQQENVVAIYQNSTEFSLSFEIGTLTVDFALASEKEGRKYGPEDLSAGFVIFTRSGECLMDERVYPAYRNTSDAVLKDQHSRFTALLQHRSRKPSEPVIKRFVNLDLATGIFREDILTGPLEKSVDPLLFQALHDVPLGLDASASSAAMWAIAVVIILTAADYGIDDDAWAALDLIKERACVRNPMHLLRLLPVREEKEDESK